jgi:hypothetical protein
MAQFDADSDDDDQQRVFGGRTALERNRRPDIEPSAGLKNSGQMSRRSSCPLRVAQTSPSTSELTRPQPGPSIDIAIAILLTEDRTHRSIQSTVLVSPCPRMSSTLPRGSREHPNHHWHLPRKYTKKNHPPSIPPRSKLVLHLERVALFGMRDALLPAGSEDPSAGLALSDRVAAL